MSMSPADLAGVRFAISPAWEVVASLRVLRDPGAHAVHLPWVTRHRDAVLAAPGLRELRDLVLTPERHLPGFLAPAPRTPIADPAAEFEASGHGDQMRAYWDLALAPYWDRMRGILEADVMFRARRLADAGPQAMFPELAPTISWADDVLSVNRPGPALDFVLGGRGLVLVPSLFAWPNVFVKAAEPWAPVLRYPARGVGAMWHDDAPAADLAAVLGRARATLLAELATPSTTTSLARRTGLAAGGISAHLARLVTAGLVARRRAGRQVFYVRTARGEALVTPG
ncbi:ArsR/SmtB family transcription factor [Actinoplanes ianthinogenes]|nr:DUF5937 family protein [Actinoplanes ianthinogenes]